MLPSIGKCVASGWALKRESTRGSSRPDGLEAGGLLDGWSATLLLPAHRADETIDNERAGDPFGLGVEIRENAMREDRLGNRLEIFHADEVTALQNGMRLGAADEILHCARAGS